MTETQKISPSLKSLKMSDDFNLCLKIFLPTFCPEGQYHSKERSFDPVKDYGFSGCLVIRRFRFALVGALYDERRYEGSGILSRVVRIEMELDESLL